MTSSIHEEEAGEGAIGTEKKKWLVSLMIQIGDQNPRAWYMITTNQGEAEDDLLQEEEMVPMVECLHLQGVVVVCRPK